MFSLICTWTNGWVNHLDAVMLCTRAFNNCRDIVLEYFHATSFALVSVTSRAILSKFTPKVHVAYMLLLSLLSRHPIILVKSPQLHWRSTVSRRNILVLDLQTNGRDFILFFFVYYWLKSTNYAPGLHMTLLYFLNQNLPRNQIQLFVKSYNQVNTFFLFTTIIVLSQAFYHKQAHKESTPQKVHAKSMLVHKYVQTWSPMAGSTPAGLSKTMLGNHFWLTWILTQILLFNTIGCCNMGISC